MNELTNVFNYNGNNVRTVIKDEKIWFCAKDTCDILDLSNSRDAVSRLDEDEKAMYLVDTQFGEKDSWFINESGLLQILSKKSKFLQCFYL